MAEPKELREIMREEAKNLRKRPQFVIGLLLSGGLAFYFLVRAFLPETLKWPSGKDWAVAALSSAVGICVAWLVLKLLRTDSYFRRVFLPFMGVWLLFMTLMTQQGAHTRWEYLSYGIAVLIVQVCSQNSVMKHFCEKIRVSKETESGQSVRQTT